MKKIGVTIIQNLSRPSTSMAMTNLKDLLVINRELHCQGNEGVLARALSLNEAKEELN